MIANQELRSWFTQEVLPLERDLERYLARYCGLKDDVVDLRQETYERALVGAQRGIPDSARAFVFAVARNLLIDRARRSRIVSFDHVADLDQAFETDIQATERAYTARAELRRAMLGLEQLPPRCREVVRLRRVEGLNIKETAERLGVGQHTVERQLTLGLKALANFMLGGDARIQRGASEPLGQRRRR
ncbi:MAG: RNA polymerase sigma factor [Proteobacteria bacterium]|nr:RNA polymerase sigma factor [Pseudomonadota bacterium]